MSRHDRTDEQWSVIEPLIPKKSRKRGRPRNDERRTLNGILYVLKTGCAWDDLPREYGSDSTCWRRLHEWSLDGTQERIGPTFLSQLDAEGKLEQAQAVLDGSFVPAKKGGDGVGKTKVGKGSKVMAVVDGDGLPIGLHVDSAQPHAITLAEPTLPTILVPRQRGRPKTRPKELVADKADDSAEFRRKLRRRGTKPTIPTFERRKRKKPRRGRPLRVGAGYRQRWKVERCFGWMDNCRRLVVRYDRHLHIYRAFCLVAIILWCLDRVLK